MDLKTGAVIITAGKSAHADSFQPMMKVGSVSAVRRLIQTFQQAGVDSVVLVMDKQSGALRKHVSYTGVICLENDDPQHTEMIDFAKIGLNYLEKKCDQVLVTPVDIPLFTVHTAQQLMQSGAQLASPSHNGRHGHPLLISSGMIPFFLCYKGANGLRGAIESCNCERTMVDVADSGILFDIELDEDYEELLALHNRQNLHPEIRTRLVKEQAFFGPGGAQLLSLIEITGCVSQACQQMNISYSNGWKIIKLMESQLGCELVQRKQGGKHGGSASLTAKGKLFLDTYYDFDTACKKAVQSLFEEYFAKV